LTQKHVDLTEPGAKYEITAFTFGIDFESCGGLQQKSETIIVEMEELAGLLVSGGLILVASSVMKADSSEAEGADAKPNAALAVESFNAAHANAVVNNKKGDKLILASSFGCPTSQYTALQASLAKIGIPVTMYATESYATIDLRPLLRSSVSFVTERKLQGALVEQGLVLCPGEACGLSEPGFFRINTPVLTKDQVSAITDTISNLAKNFNTATKRSLASTEAPSTAAKEAQKDDDDASVAESVPDSVSGRGTESTRKRRKNV
jgi:hypothetical protein